MLAQTEKSLAAEAFYKDCETLTINLYGRWLDEREYENIQDYAAPYAELAKKHGVTIQKMNKSPFGLDFAVDGRIYKLYCKARQYGYKRIK